MPESKSGKISRRAFSILILLSAAFLFFTSGNSAPPPAKAHYLALLGTYTSKTESKGIYAFDYVAAAGRLVPKGVAAELPEPSYLVIDRAGKFVYAVSEAGKESKLTAYSLDAKTFSLTKLNQVDALGEDPCYIAFDKTGKFIFVANYTGGSITVFPILPDGRLGPHTALIQNKGTGANKERQDAAHAHWIEPSPDNHYVFLVDLGLDEILSYRFDASKGTLTPNDPAFTKMAPGSGPRHATFSPNGKFFYVTSELNSTVTALSYDASKGTLQQLQVLPTLPADFHGRNDTAEIAVHPNGKWLYVSNRGKDSIALFNIDPAKGTLTYSSEFATGGKEPRHFAIDPSGHYLLTENQNSGTVVTYRIDTPTGKLAPAGSVAFVPAPVCLAFDLAN